MLKLRLLTALVLIVVLVAALWAPQPIWFVALSLLMIAAAGWEWGRLNTRNPVLQWFCVLLTMLLCLLALACFLQPQPDFLLQSHAGLKALTGQLLTAFSSSYAQALWWLVGLLWLLAGPWLLRRGVDAWQTYPLWLRLACGVLTLAAAWFALLQWFVVGIYALISVLVLVWAADTGAYFVGRTWGRRKLAPGISPGKSWEGVLGGWLAVALVAVLYLALDRIFSDQLDSVSLYGQLLNRLGWFFMLLGVWLLASMSVVGDLLESLVKRSAGMKDSSQLLPGHGGVLDRIDALLPVLPLSMLLVHIS